MELENKKGEIGYFKVEGQLLDITDSHPTIDVFILTLADGSELNIFIIPYYPSRLV